MYQLSVSAACSYVRRALDELVSVEDIGMLVDPDAVDIHRLVEGAIVEAAVKVHNAAPALMLEGVWGVEDEDYSVSAVDDDESVLSVSMLKPTLRLASFRSDDSDVVVTELIPEDSAEGRKQLNQYTRGTYDDPRLVLMKRSNGDHMPMMRYYSAAGGKRPEVNLEYIPYPVITESIVEVCPRLEYDVLHEVTAMVLESLGEKERASLYRKNNNA